MSETSTLFGLILLWNLQGTGASDSVPALRVNLHVCDTCDWL